MTYLRITQPNYIFWLLASILLFAFLGSREIWTQEWRWGEIVRVMLLHHDYFHPTLAGQPYFDKPLLSYWLMVAITKLTGPLSTWTIRLPSAISGLISIACLYQIGATWQNRKIAGIAAIMLTTTYYFLFWARTASSDALNVAGILCAVAWYFSKREQPGFINYSVFFLIVALTALLKGLIAPVIILLTIFPNIVFHSALDKKPKKLSFPRRRESIVEMPLNYLKTLIYKTKNGSPPSRERQLREYLQTIKFLKLMPIRKDGGGITKWKLLIALLPAMFVYFLPFWLTSLANHTSFSQNGLYEVYRENILRFFEPFDHKDPLYTYFIYLPIYLLPWTAFFLPALYQLPKRWSELDLPVKQLAIANACLFLLLTLSGSRRSYYILPLIPFAILLTAEWISVSKTRIKLAYYTATISFLGLFSWFILFQPLYYSDGGLAQFSQQLTQLTTEQAPEKIWRVVFLHADNRLSFYLPHYEITFLRGDKPDPKHYDILITREIDLNQLKNLKARGMLVMQPHRGNRWLQNTVLDAPVAVYKKADNH